MHLKLLQKGVIHKTAESTDNLTGNKIIKSASQKTSETASQTDKKSIEIPKRR